ncbi:MAG TPA: PAS domain-containing protein [Candidatus Limnocylindrales bacterium]|nr:PAS domain-containing protein [Candidatus Limnocylindrales bacterium]
MSAQTVRLSIGAATEADGREPLDGHEPPSSLVSAAPVDLALVLSGVSAGISVQDRSGRLLFANALAARMAGFDSPEELVAAPPGELVARFSLLDETGAPLHPDELPGRRVLLGEAPDPILVGFRLADGAERWSLLSATAAVLPDGRDIAINTFHDVTARIEAERRVRERERRFREMSEKRRKAEERLDSVLREMPVGVILVDATDGRLMFANDAARRLPHIRFRIGEPLRYLDNEGRHLDGSRLGPDDWPLRRAMRGETVRNDVITITDDAGVGHTYNISAGPMRDRSGGVDLLIETLSDVTERVAAQDRERFLARASEVLASSLDYEETVRTVANLAVPQFADWCVVQLANADGAPEPIAVAHRDPQKVALAMASSREYPEDPSSPSSAAAIIRNGHTVFIPEITQEQVDAAARDDRHRKLLREITIRSALSVPLVAGGRTTGVLSLVNGESGRRFEESDVEFAQALATRAAGAIENARLFREGVRFKRLLDATGDAVLLLEMDGSIAYANQSAGEQLGRDAAELVGSSIGERLDPVDRAALAEAIGQFKAGRPDARTLTLRLQRPDLEPRPVEIRLQLVTLVAEPVRILAVARDRREQIAAENALRTLAIAEHARAAELNAVIRAMGEGVVVCDRDGQIILANPAAEDVFPDVDETSYADILGELDDPTGSAPRLGIAGGPVELRAKRGDERWIEVSTWPVSHDVDEDLRDETIVILRDVTEARQQKAVRDTFIGVLSHELRTPVTTIYAGAKVLARPGSDLPSDTRAEIFNDIVVESERLHRLVEDVVAMTRFGEQSGDVGAEPVLLQRLLPSVIASEEGRWPGVQFELRVPAGLPTVIADPTYVEQVVRNLLSNAAKYGGAGATVGIAVESTATEVLVRILDDGPGFPPDETERLFELFFRSARTSRTASGAGIGLFVCARLIRAMGGRIWATNRPGGGAEFGFALRVMSEDS